MHRCVLALGSNLGDRQQILRQAIGSLAKLTNVSLEGVSPFVESHALTVSGVDPTQPNYLNCVVEIKTDLEPMELLAEINKIEQQFGRERANRWESRTLDIDIISYGKLQLKTEQLTIPHPSAHERGFVLVPWMLLDERAELIGHGAVATLAQEYEKSVWVVDDAD